MSVVRPAPSLPLCRPAEQSPTDRQARGGPATLRANPCPDVTDPSCRLPLPLVLPVLTSENTGPRRVGTTDRWVEPDAPPAKGSDELGPADFQGSSGAHRTPHQWRRSAGPSGLSPVGPLPGQTRPRQRETTTLAGAPADVSGGPSQSRRRRGTGSVPSVREYRPDSLSPPQRAAGFRIDSPACDCR